MAKYRIEVKKSATKEMRKLPKKDLRQIVSKISELADNPHPVGSKRLSGRNRYRIRHGNYRVLYSVEEDRLIIYVVKVGHRKSVYR